MVMPNVTVSANDFSLAQIPSSRQIITWAANEKERGSVKKFDLTNLRVIARVEQVIPAGTTPLSEVSSGIRTQLMNEKKAEKIITDLQAKNLTSLDAYAAAMNTVADTVRFVNFTTRNITGLGVEPVLNAVSAFAPVGKVVGPIWVCMLPGLQTGQREQKHTTLHLRKEVCSTAMPIVSRCSLLKH
jgi:peptidyl-prolyl cis-trans isomerase D